MKIPLITSGCTISLDKFWKSVLVFHDKPHILNKKISGNIQLYFYEVKNTGIEDLLQYITHSSILYEIRKSPELSKHSLKHLVADILSPYDKTLELKETDRDLFCSTFGNIFISLRILIPKNALCKKCLELIVLDTKNNTVTFYNVGERNKYLIAPIFPYHIERLLSGHVRITVDNFEDANTSSADWLVDKVFSKIMKWSTDEYIDKPQTTLSLIYLEKYFNLYQKLKEKYGKKMVTIWSENTDPLKFVYEDVAIATYLICLWETIDPVKQPTFLDLGCGNGLLVYILAQEGYKGYGIDVRKRKIWDTYPENTKLMVKTIIPSSSSLFPDTDWIIGNHSDELTPWIPIIAMRSSHTTKFFLLPCCSYDFSGKKYARVNTSKSQYLEYLDYIQDICIKCGFTVKADKLRIPSTKRTCIISYGRTYEPNEFQIVNQKIAKFIEDRCGSVSKSEEKWIENFKPRNNFEKVTNCTQLNRDLVHRVVMQVVIKLLEENIPLRGDDDKLWNQGSQLPFSKIISSIKRDDLKQLKNNCGGLQTLLRNHKYIFEVINGSVKIRIPKKYSETNKYKSKPCWFLKNHPDGCLNDAESCCYNHI